MTRVSSLIRLTRSMQEQRCFLSGGWRASGFLQVWRAPAPLFAQVPRWLPRSVAAKASTHRNFAQFNSLWVSAH